MWREYLSVTRIADALQVLSEQGQRARIVAGATDLILEIERGVRRGIETVVDITRVPGLNTITMDEDGVIHLGPLVTHNHCVASKLVVESGFPLAQAAWEVGAPQIRNRGTVAGNLITASPANDTITPLMAMGAWVTLASVHGERQVKLEVFYTGVRKTVMRQDEMLVDIAFPGLKQNQRGAFIKLGLRRSQAISVINVAVVLTLEDERVQRASITLGAVAPMIIHAAEAEAYLQGRSLDEEVITQAAALAMQAAHPIDDVRSPADYRSEMVRVCTRRALRMIHTGKEKAEFPQHPPMLWGDHYSNEAPLRFSPLPHMVRHNGAEAILTQVNGVEYRIENAHEKTLLRMLREDVGLTGTKEGCAEGECGACTVFLDGAAVMSCMVPAPRAHGAQIVTIEGVAQDGQLHPVQNAFIEEGAVQCGYCTPGFIMSAVKLLEEEPHPSHETIQQAITGNLCRCTGYYSIVKAIELAASAPRGEVSDGKIR
jgi:xanthine dehydrogenase iron-sulfur cluster and FAD-binding subunit A